MTYKKTFAVIIAALMLIPFISLAASAVEDGNNSDWAAKTAVVHGTDEAELMVRTGDIDALSGEDPNDLGYNPFTAVDQYSHNYPWPKDDTDPAGTDRIFVGTHGLDEARDGYSSNYVWYKNGDDSENAYGDGALEITMEYDVSGISVRNALLQLCIDDFQAISFDSVFTVKLNGKDAPFIAELLNHVDQTGPTSYIVSAIIPSGFYSEISSGRLVITIDESAGVGDGYSVDFAKLLVNYNSDIFTGSFRGKTEPGATVRLLGTSTTVTAAADGSFEFEAIPGLNAVRASKDGYAEGYDFGIVIAGKAAPYEGYEVWEARVNLDEGEGSADIDFSQFGTTAAWSNASGWAEAELQEAANLGLIPDCLNDADMTKPITRAEFAAVSVKVYEALSGQKAAPAAVNPFTDTADTEVLKAFEVGITTGTSATTFHPDRLLNREQAATMLTRVFKKVAIEGWEMSRDSDFNEIFNTMFEMPEPFADDDRISDWAKPSVYFMSAKGIINGTGQNRFSPRAVTDAEVAIGYAQATREQAIAIATRMVKNLK